MIMAPIERIDEDVARMHGYMKRASEIVLAGFALGTEAMIVKYPDR